MLLLGSMKESLARDDATLESLGIDIDSDFFAIIREGMGGSPGLVASYCAFPRHFS